MGVLSEAVLLRDDPWRKSCIVQFDRTFSAAHRLWNDDSKCRNVHGHNFKVAVTIDATGLEFDLTDQGFLIPFAAVKQAIDRYDHVLILHKDDPKVEYFFATDVDIILTPLSPSTENMAQRLAEEIAALLLFPSAHVGVKLRETDGIAAYGSAVS